MAEKPLFPQGKLPEEMPANIDVELLRVTDQANLANTEVGRQQIAANRMNSLETQGSTESGTTESGSTESGSTDSEHVEQLLGDLIEIVCEKNPDNLDSEDEPSLRIHEDSEEDQEDVDDSDDEKDTLRYIIQQFQRMDAEQYLVQADFRFGEPDSDSDSSDEEEEEEEESLRSRARGFGRNRDVYEIVLKSKNAPEKSEKDAGDGEGEESQEDDDESEEDSEDPEGSEEEDPQDSEDDQEPQDPREEPSEEDSAPDQAPDAPDAPGAPEDEDSKKDPKEDPAPGQAPEAPEEKGSAPGQAPDASESSESPKEAPGAPEAPGQAPEEKESAPESPESSDPKSAPESTPESHQAPPLQLNTLQLIATTRDEEFGDPMTSSTPAPPPEFTPEDVAFSEDYLKDLLNQGSGEDPMMHQVRQRLSRNLNPLPSESPEPPEDHLTRLIRQRMERNCIPPPPPDQKMSDDEMLEFRKKILKPTFAVAPPPLAPPQKPSFHMESLLKMSDLREEFSWDSYRESSEFVMTPCFSFNVDQPPFIPDPRGGLCEIDDLLEYEEAPPTIQDPSGFEESTTPYYLSSPYWSTPDWIVPPGK